MSVYTYEKGVSVHICTFLPALLSFASSTHHLTVRFAVSLGSHSHDSPSPVAARSTPASPLFSGSTTSSPSPCVHHSYATHSFPLSPAPQNQPKCTDVYTVTFSCHLFTVTFSGWLRTVRDPAYRNERSEGFFRGCLLSDGPPRWLRYRSRATRMAAAHYGDPAYRNERSEGFFRSCLLSDGPPRWRRYGSRATRIKQPPFCNFG